MFKQIIPVDENTTILITTLGDLNLQGWNRQEVEVSSRKGRFHQISREEGILKVTATNDCVLQVPVNAAVKIERVSGDASLRNLDGEIEMKSIGGDLMVGNVAKLTINNVGGDVSISTLRERLDVKHVGGDMEAVGVAGLLQIDHLGGDAELMDVEKDCRFRAGGDVEVAFKPGVTPSLTCKAGGDISLYFAGQGDAQVTITSHGHDIRIDKEGRMQHLDQREFSMVLGQGKSAVRLEAGGDVSISDRSVKTAHSRAWDEMESEWQEWERDNRFGVEIPFVSMDWDAQIGDIGRLTQDAVQKAEKRVKSAMRQVEEQTRQIEDQVRQARNMGWGPMNPVIITPPPAPVESVGPEVVVEPASATEASTGVSDEERLLVLKMLQEKKITVEEAEQLLAALEGEE